MQEGALSFTSFALYDPHRSYVAKLVTHRMFINWWYM